MVLEAIQGTLDNSRMNRTLVHFVILLVASTGLSSLTVSAQTAQEGRSMSFHISTTSFPLEGSIPKKYTCDGKDVSPELSWAGAPQGTKSFALIVDDPDAPAGTWNHWLIWNIPTSQHELNEGASRSHAITENARQGQNDFRKIGYNGPCPPPGKPHRYYFKLFALDTELTLPAGSDRKQLDTAIRGHVLAQSELMGRYGRER